LCAITACASVAELDKFRLCVEGCEDQRDAAASGGGGGDASCDADLQSDAKNCGYCGHDCLGGACQDGTCKPVTIVSGNMNVVQLAAHGPDLYWLELVSASPQTRLWTCSASRCESPQRLFEPARVVDTFAVTGAGVFASSHVGESENDWASAEIVRCTPRSCAQGTYVTSVTPHASAMAMEGAELFWLIDSTGELRRCVAEDCASTTSTLGAATASPIMLVAGGGRFFWVTRAFGAQPSSSKLHGLGVGQSTPWTFDPKVTVSAIAMRGEHLFYAGRSALMRVNGTTAEKVGGDGQPLSIATDDSHVYWTVGGAGSIFRCPLAGCAGEPEVVIASQADIKEVTVAGGAVYFARPSGIFKVAKP
jgi:hypothetical protein